jgi:DNA polymerase elongation subunit (family B)
VYSINTNLPVWKIEQGEEDQRIRFLNMMQNVGIRVYEADVSSLDRFCIDNQVAVEDDYYIGYFDIETDDRVGSFEPGAGRILSCAIVDNFGKVWYFTHKNEYILLRKIVSTLRQFSIIVGYNSDKFDLPYIKVRCEKSGIKFPLHDMIHIDLWDRIKTNYMYDKEGPADYRLDTVAQHFLKKGKAKFDNEEGFYWNWKNNHDAHKEYNIQDTVLLKELDDHLEIIPTMVLQCKLCGIFLNKFWNTRLTDMGLLRLAREEGAVLPTKYLHNKIPMPGGRVMNVTPGLYTGVYVWDFSQMYSTIMRSFNISPEALRVKNSLWRAGATTEERNSFITSPVDMAVKLYFGLMRKYFRSIGKEMPTPSGWWHWSVNKVTKPEYKAMRKHVHVEIQKKLTIKFLQSLDYFIKVKQLPLPKGAMIDYENHDLAFIYDRQPRFEKGYRSLVWKLLDRYVRERDAAKAREAAAKAKLKKLKAKLKKAKGAEKEKIAGKIAKAEVEFKLAHQYNLAYKLMGNVVFGYMSSHKNRCYSHAIACSITLGGQEIISIVAVGAEKKFTVMAIGGDTDSVFFQTDLPADPKEIAKFDEKFLKWFKPFLDKTLKDKYGIDDHCMNIEPKSFYDVLLILAKKNYVGWSSITGEYDTQGIAFVKRSTIKYAATLQEKLIKDLIHKPEFRDAEGLTKWAQAERDKFFGLEVDDIDSEILDQLTFHTRVKKHPDEYDTNPLHVRIVRRMLNEGKQFFIGDVLSYVVIESDAKLQQGASVEEFIQDAAENGSGPDAMRIDKTHYWKQAIFSKLMPVLKAVHPDINWEVIDPTLNAAREERIAKIRKSFMSASARKHRAHDRLVKATKMNKPQAILDKHTKSKAKAQEALDKTLKRLLNMKVMHHKDKEQILGWAKEEGYIPSVDEGVGQVGN